MFRDYNIGYLDGRNHTLELTAKWIQHVLSKKKLSTEEILTIIQDKTALKETLLDYDPAFFNNYDKEIGPLE